MKNVTGTAENPEVEHEGSGALTLTSSQVGLMERAQIDSQVATARAFPRDLEMFKKNSLAMVTFDPETAEACIYHRPVGKKLNEKTGKMEEEIAEGESIRLAEIVAACFGNLRVEARIVEQTPAFVKAEGVALDLQSNYAGKSQVIESTLKKNGTPYSERQAMVVAKVALSKAYRDAVFRVIPKSMCKFLKDAAIKAAARADVPIEKRREGALKWAKSKGIDEPRVLAALQVKAVADITEEHLVTLTGLRTAIKEGDTSIDEAFPPISDKPDLGAGAPTTTPSSSAPTLTTAGQGPVTEPSRPTTAAPVNAAQTPLATLREKLGAAKITDENIVLNYLIEVSNIPDSFQTLEEVFLSQTVAITSLLEPAAWDAFIKKVAPPTPTKGKK